MKYLFLILVVISLSGFGQTADDYYNKGISKFNIKDYKGAISEFNKTIILNPNYADAYINRGIAKKKTLDYTGAITDYNKAIQLNPNNSDYFYNRGIAKYNLEDYNGSISDFNKAIELNSDNSDAYVMKEDATKKLKGNSESLKNKENRQPSIDLPSDFFCKEIESKIDKFEDKQTFTTPIGLFFKSGIRFYKIVDKGIPSFYLSVHVSGSTINIGEKGVIILFKDGSKFTKPEEKIDVKVGSGTGYSYSSFIRLTLDELKVFSLKSISDTRLYIYDNSVEEQSAEKIKEYLKCLIK